MEAQVMGMMQGRAVPYWSEAEGKEKGMFVVLDAFALPVEGTETRVNAQEEAYEYMVHYMEGLRSAGREENVVGWYHSHPGYGCWLSGVDVATQRTNQTYQEPFLAIVVDPVRTVASGKVELGAFRTLPERAERRQQGQQSGRVKASETGSVPLHKVEDFGVHASEYYALEVAYFRSEADAGLFNLLWRDYWSQALSGCTEEGFLQSQASDAASKLADGGRSPAIDAGRGGARAAIERCKAATARAAAAEALCGSQQ